MLNIYAVCHWAPSENFTKVDYHAYHQIKKIHAKYICITTAELLSILRNFTKDDYHADHESYKNINW